MELKVRIILLGMLSKAMLGLNLVEMKGMTSMWK